MKKTLLLTWSLLLCIPLMSQNSPVKVWEGELTLPTYRVDAPEKAPMFARDFAYQRAKRWVYPYPMNDNPTGIKVDSTHRALFLENDYVKVCVLPDIGGRLFFATDKTNGYEIFYRQHVIKPANVGMLGAWISGGVEWNVFHHHRATSQYPIDYSLESNADGSKTIWVGEVEHRHRMSWAVGLTLHPDKSYIEVTGRFFNDSPDRNSMLHWNNVATHANENYQIIFPESTQFGMFHHKSSHIHWPVANEPYKGNADFVGVDVSYWKNLPSLTGDSVFIQDLQDDFVGGYDHGKNAGTMLVGNHNICKGGKFWTWGHKAYGHAWDCVTLTDEDGPYVELMTSAYSDNQPDYCWINPGETKEFTAYWYGIRDLAHVNRGNREATVNMDIDPSGKIHVAANTTQIRRAARVDVANADKILYSKVIDIAPDKPFADDFCVAPADVKEPQEVLMSLFDCDGRLLIDYHPYKHDIDSPLPEDLKPVNPDPRSVKNTEECYYIGMRNLQFHQAHVDPNDYFLEVLRRDPGDVRANTQMGIYFRKNGDYDNAKKYLRRAISRQCANYTRPEDGEAMYNLGLVLKAEQKWHDAVDTLYRAVWDYEYASAGYYQLAQISSMTGNYAQALQEVDMSVRYNGMNVDAMNLKTSLLRKLGMKQDAIDLARQIVSIDPLSYYANNELQLMGALPKEKFRKLLRDVPESYLDVAVAYLNNGLGKEGRALLEDSFQIKPYPTTAYYIGYLDDLADNTEGASKWFEKASSLPTDYVYPFRLETVCPLEKAVAYNPQDPVARYYLGNLWYQMQPEKAAKIWEEALAYAPDNAMVLRNMGWYWRFKDEGKEYKDVQDYTKAIEYYKKAIAADPSSALFLTECDEIMEYINAPLADRYALFAGKEQVYCMRYDSEVRAIRQMILAGEYEHAMSLLSSHEYSRREHIDDLHDTYVDLCQLMAFRSWKEGDNTKALEYMLKSDEYPDNHGYAHLEYYGRDAQIRYYIGLAYEKMGNAQEAGRWYELAADTEVKDKDVRFLCEKGFALEKLGRKKEARGLYKHVVAIGKANVTTYFNTFFESFDRGPFEQDVNTMAYYTQAMGYKALGRSFKARRMLKRALKERNDNVWAGFWLCNSSVSPKSLE